MRVISLLAGTCAIALFLGGNPANATTITFDTAPVGQFNGALTESGFIYAFDSGRLVVSAMGNPGNDMEGDINILNVGILNVVSSTPGTLFTFKGLDFAAVNIFGQAPPAELIVTGFIGGVAVAVDDYFHAVTDTYQWTTESAGSLAGVSVDKLAISLFTPRTSSYRAYDAVDNIQLAAVPEPATVTLLGASVAAFGAIRRRRRMV